MTDFPWLTTLALVPLIGAVAVAAMPATRELLAKQVTLGFSLATLALTVAMALQFDSDSSAEFQFAEVHEWIPQFGVSYALGVDGIALVLIALATVLTPVCVLASWHDVESQRRSVKGYFALLLLLETFMIGVFAATDVFLFYVLFEAMLVPMYFIIGSYGGPQRSYAAVKFLLYSLAGGLLMLAAVIGLYVVSDGGPQAFLFERLLGTEMGTATERLLFLGFFVAFAIKAPLWPVHTWLPDAAAESPPGGAVLLVGVLDKVGTFGMIRFCLPLFPDASLWARPVVITLAVVGILYGALLAIGQTDMRRLIAYTSISHFGFIVMGIFAMTAQSQAGASLYMVNHGFSTAALFLIAGFLVSRRGSRLIADYGGVQRVAPMLAGTFLLAGLSSLALPGLSTLRQRVPGAGRHVLEVRGGGRHRDRRHHPRLGLHPADVPADHDRGADGAHREDARPHQARGLGRRTPDRGHRRAGLLPAAGARRHQPGGGPHHAAGRCHRPRAGRPARRKGQPNDGRAVRDPLGRVPPADADAHRLRRGDRRRPAGGLHGSHGGATRPSSASRSPGWSPLSSRSSRWPARTRSPPWGRWPSTARAVPAGHHPAARDPRWSCGAAERSTDEGGAFAPAGSSMPGSRHERLLTADRVTQTEVFPLLMFAVGGMLLFPASNDLLTMFVALEVLSLPLYLLCGLARRRRLLSQEAVSQVLPARRVLLRLLPLRRRSALRLLGHRRARWHRRCGQRRGGQRGAAADRHRAADGRPALQGRRGALPLLDPGRLPGRPHADHRLHGRVHQGRGVRGPAAGALRRRRRAWPGTGSR